MEHTNLIKKIKSYIKNNPELSKGEFDTLLLIGNIYRTPPKDLLEFKEIYLYFNPEIINNFYDGLNFLRITEDIGSAVSIRESLNAYLNTKYNYLGQARSYSYNAKKFKHYSLLASTAFQDIIDKGMFPDSVRKIIQESEEVQKCYDVCDLLYLYKNTSSKRIKYEILRKIGTINILCRIEKSSLVESFDLLTGQIKNVFKHGLGLKKKSNKFYYLWIDHNDDVVFEENRLKAEELYNRAVRLRKEFLLPIYPIQVFEYTPTDTIFGQQILYINVRNKLLRGNKLSYSSTVEKIIRKNLEFPNQVRDVRGVRLIVESEEGIPDLIESLETFLGDSSSRKKEKNVLHKYGKKKLGEYSSDKYFIWKAIHDITLPHPYVAEYEKLLAITKDNKIAQKEISKKLRELYNTPQNIVVEVQIQDITSYLLSVANGSPTHHKMLKMKQVRSNTFYKLFPKEIYWNEFASLRKKILSGSNSKKSRID